MARNCRINGFPNLLCRPCERRVNNTITFKNVISETQKSLLKDSRTKQCLDISPSVAIPAAKVTVEGAVYSMCLPQVMNQQQWPRWHSLCQLK